MDAGDNGVILLPRTYKRAQVKRKNTNSLEIFSKGFPDGWQKDLYNCNILQAGPWRLDCIWLQRVPAPGKETGEGFLLSVGTLPDDFFWYSLQVLAIYLADANEPREGWCCWSNCDNDTRQWNSVYAVFFHVFSETCDTNRFVAPGNYAHFAGSLWRIFYSVIQVIRHITCAKRLVHRWKCLPLYRFHPALLGIYATRCMAVVPQPCGDAHGCREDRADIIIRAILTRIGKIVLSLVGHASAI